MSRFENVPTPAYLLKKLRQSPRAAYLALCLTLFLSVAVLWTAFFFVVTAGLLGAALGYWLHYGQSTDNPLQVVRPVWGFRRAWVVTCISGACLILSLSFFFSGLLTPEGKYFMSAFYLTCANGFFSFSASFFTLGTMVMSDAKVQLEQASVAQTEVWRQEAETAGPSFYMRSTRKA